MTFLKSVDTLLDIISQTNLSLDLKKELKTSLVSNSDQFVIGIYEVFRLHSQDPRISYRPYEELFKNLKLGHTYFRGLCDAVEKRPLGELSELYLEGYEFAKITGIEYSET